jgi:hypothetical protein
VPSQESLQFCSNNTEFDNIFQSVADSVEHALLVLAVIVLVLAFAAMLPYIALEWWTWRKVHRQARVAEDSLRSMEKTDYVEMLQRIANPITNKVADMIGRKLSPRKKILVRWYLAYITHPRALLVLAISLAGFLSCLFQLALLREVQNSAPLLLAEVGDIEGQISQKIRNASDAWVTGTNDAIFNVEQDINVNVLGWAVASTQSLNNTLNTCNPILGSAYD